MTITELIGVLERLKAEHGDLEVYGHDLDFGMYPIIEDCVSSYTWSDPIYFDGTQHVILIEYTEPRC